MVKTFKQYIVYTNPPCNDRLSYHRSLQKSMRQVDQSKKLCYQCDLKAVIIVSKKYYCATCGINKQ